METPSRALEQLAAEYWEAGLQASPVSATFMGDHRWDDRLGDNSPAGFERELTRYRDTLQRLEAIDRSSLSPSERITWVALQDELARGIEGSECRMWEWTVSSRYGPHIQFANIAAITRIADPAAGEKFLSRWSKVGAHIDQDSENLRRGLAAGKVAPRTAIETSIEQLDALLPTPIEEWPIASPTPGEGFDEEQSSEFLEKVRTITADTIAPALQRHRDLLAEELLPRSRSSEQVGLSHLPDGAACYDIRVRAYTTLPLSADEVHRIGLDEVARLRTELSELGGRALGTTDITVIQDQLRTDPKLHFETREEVEAKASEALQRATAAIPQWFGRLPQAPCVVKRVPEYEEKDTTIAYYRRPAADGSRPGTYYVNTYAPETRPRYEAEVLAFHESIPGHHLQLAIGQELEGLPEFRKHDGATAFVEGWGLYSERLADEMGLYGSGVDRLGVLSFDLWRACRLVVDTGIHAKGWSRDRAIEYLFDNTLLARNNVENEVDRYIEWPGQALAYKIGQREILRLRAAAEERLGDRFDIRAFHDVVLGNGALSLPALAQAVEDWIESQ